MKPCIVYQVLRAVIICMGRKRGRRGGGGGGKTEKQLCLLLFSLALFQCAHCHIMAAVDPLWKIEKSKMNH